MLVFKQLIVYIFSDHAIYENSELEKTDPLNEIKVEKADEKESINKEEKSSQQILSQSQVCRLNEFFFQFIDKDFPMVRNMHAYIWLTSTFTFTLLNLYLKKSAGKKKLGKDHYM